MQEINHLFVDIDSDKKRSLNYQECEELLTCFLERVEIEPTLSIFTGHGLQLIWNIQGVSVNEWDTCEKNIHVKVNEALKDIKENSISNLVNALEYCSVHLDNCVSDKARVLRIPGTRNTNDIDPNLYARMMDWNTTTYNKTQLDKIGLNKRKTRDFKAYSNHDRIKIIATETEREKRLTAFQEKQIKPRIDDLIKLIELRNTQGITTGYRNNLIRILTATWQNLGTHPKETRKKLKAVNSMFIKPLEQKELESWLKATYATRKTENGYKKGVRIKSATIILMLEITPEEQKFMKALKDDSTRRKEKRKVKTHA